MTERLNDQEAVAYLKQWWDGQSRRTRVDLGETCEAWLDALNPDITPLYAHPTPVVETKCYECNADLHGPYCPACNPVEAALAPTSLRSVEEDQGASQGTTPLPSADTGVAT